MPNPLTVWTTTNWKILQEMGIPDDLNCLLRNLYAGQETTVRTGHGTTGWFHRGKGVHQGCILSPCFFTYIQSTSWEMLGWMKHKLESRFQEKYQYPQIFNPWSGRYPGEGNGNPLQCSCLENPRDGRAWWAAVYGVAQSRTRLKWLSSSSSSRVESVGVLKT